MILPGSRVKVFDYRLFKDDKTTPPSYTVRPATVLCRYGFRSEYNPTWIYPDCVDVLFDHDSRISKGHFTEYVDELPSSADADSCVPLGRKAHGIRHEI